MRSNAMFILLGGLALVRCLIRFHMHPYNGIYYFHQQNISIVSLSSLLMPLTNANKYFKNFFFAFHMWHVSVRIFHFYLSLFVSFVNLRLPQSYSRHHTHPAHRFRRIFSCTPAGFSESLEKEIDDTGCTAKTVLVSERDRVVAKMA